MARKIGRIETELIFSELVRTNTGIYLHYANRRYQAHVISIDGQELMVEIDEEKTQRFLVGRKLQLFFTYKGEKTTCTPIVMRDEGKQIQLRNSGGAYDKLNRAHERVVGDRNIAIELASTRHQELNYPVSRMTINDDIIDSQISKLTGSFSDLVAAFRKLGADNGLDTHIIMFRNHPPQHLGEKVMARIGKPVSIPLNQHISRSDTYAQKADIEQAITDLDAGGERESGEQRALGVADQIPHFADRSQQVLFPLIFRSLCVGYLLVAAQDAGQQIDANTLQKFQNIAWLVVAALKRGNYFSDILEDDDASISQLHLLDISPGGLSCRYQRQQPRFGVGDRVRIALTFGKSNTGTPTLVLSTLVSNAKSSGRLHTISVKFIDIGAEAVQQLIDYLYN